jgi:hypothetical protein
MSVIPGITDPRRNAEEAALNWAAESIPLIRQPRDYSLVEKLETALGELSITDPVLGADLAVTGIRRAKEQRVQVKE